MTADGWPSRNIEVELQGPDPGWIETLFYHRRTLMVENAFYADITARKIVVVDNVCFSDCDVGVE